MNALATLRLESTYKELDRGLDLLLQESGAACRECGRCCTFPPGSPVLYATAIEHAYLAAGWPPAERELPPGTCPFVDETTRLCTARERRPVGCRTYFCEKALPSADARAEAEALAERALAEIRRIAEEHGLEWDYAPLVDRLQ